MTEKHAHELAATWMMSLLDYDTFNIGCHECGPQWVVTVNWTDQTFIISWVNMNWRIEFDRDDKILTVDQEPVDIQEPDQGGT